MHIRSAALLILIFSSAGATSADKVVRMAPPGSITAQDMRDECNSPRKECSAYFMGYLNGQSNALVEAGVLAGVDVDKQNKNPPKFFPYCLPDSLSAGELKQLFMKFLSEKPMYLGFPVGYTTSAMLMARFPCKGRK